MAIKLGLVGKTNTGKTTFFNSATLRAEEVAIYPFTTKTPHSGVGTVATLCVHKEFGVEDSPKNSICQDGWRFIPVEIIDLPGLIKGAWQGKGLGNQFLSIAAQSDALLHIVDASGSVDAEGKITETGTGDPVADIGDIEEEFGMWYLKLMEANRDRLSRLMRAGGSPVTAFLEIYQGIGVRENHVKTALEQIRLVDKKFDEWSFDDSRRFAWLLRDLSKPTLIVANKMDLPTADANFKRIQEEYSDMIVVPASAEAELVLRRAEQKNLIKYVPGEERFEILEQSGLDEKQRWALNFIRRTVLRHYMRTGVQFAINVAVLKLLRMNTVYPVHDPAKKTDSKGKVLPDVFLMPSGSQVQDLAKEIHTDLAKGLLYAVDARTGIRLPVDYELKDRDVLSIVSASRRR